MIITIMSIIIFFVLTMNQNYFMELSILCENILEWKDTEQSLRWRIKFVTQRRSDAKNDRKGAG
jgi:hypothetical protein